MSSNTAPILIVGAGPAGLVSAICLALNGINVRIIDKSDEYHIGSRGFGIQPRTFELFKTLGILEEVQRLSTPIPTMRAYKLPGGTVPVKTWDLYEKSGTIWPDRPFGNGACLSQATLEKIMRDRLAQLSVFVQLQTELVEIEQSGEQVTATLLNHSSNIRETVSISYLIGADGAKGSTRKLLGLTFQGETRDTDGMVWGDVTINGLGSDYWHIWGKPGHFTFMARPLQPNGNQFGIGITGQNFDPTELAQPAKVQQFMNEQIGRTDLQFGEFTWLSYFKPNMRMVNKFNEGRAFVVGDAAHVHSPTGGQGMNCSVQDASNLAWKLALVLKGLASPSLLTSYNTERLPVITQMLHATTALYTHTVAKEKPTPKEEAKGDADEDEDKKSGWFRWRNSALEMYGINYRFSDIVLEERDITPQDPEDTLARAYQGYEGFGALHAGDRAPEAPDLVYGGSTTSLFSLLNPAAHTVLVFPASLEGGDLDAVLAAITALPEGTVQTFVVTTDQLTTPDGNRLVDRGGHARDAYMVKEGELTVVIIRPDSFIGAVLKDVEGVKRYFAKIFKAGA